jgi:hypothetical protein
VARCGCQAGTDGCAQLRSPIARLRIASSTQLRRSWLRRGRREASFQSCIENHASFYRARAGDRQRRERRTPRNRRATWDHDRWVPALAYSPPLPPEQSTDDSADANGSGPGIDVADGGRAPRSAGTHDHCTKDVRQEFLPLPALTSRGGNCACSSSRPTT